MSVVDVVVVGLTCVIVICFCLGNHGMFPKRGAESSAKPRPSSLRHDSNTPQDVQKSDLTLDGPW